MDDARLTAAVKAAKRSDAYRMSRSHLAEPAPTDVWFDDGSDLSFVVFRLRRSSGEGFLGFAVAADRTVVQSGRLHVDYTPDGWRAEHVAPAAELAEGHAPAR